MRNNVIARAGRIALAGNLVLAAGKLAAGIHTGSIAVIGDGIDSAGDVAIAVITLIISVIIVRPSDKGHPWGHGRAETTATLALSFLIFFAGMQLAASSFKIIFDSLRNSSIRDTLSVAPPIDEIALIVTACSIVGKLALAFSQYHLGKKAESAMVLANAVNMRNDVVVSVSVLAGLLISRTFDMPIADPAAAFLVSLWIIKNAFTIFREANTELMDGNVNAELYKTLFEKIRTVPGVSNPHRARIRKIASRLDIDLDIEVDGAMSVRNAHKLANKVESALHDAIPDIYDIMVHIEPAGGAQAVDDEQYGLSEDDVQ